MRYENYRCGRSPADTLDRTVGVKRYGEGDVRGWMVWTVAVLGGAVAAVLVTVALIADLDTADRLASVCGAVVGVAALVWAVVSATSRRGGGVRRLRAGQGGVAAGGDVVGNAIGRNSQVAGPASVARPGRRAGDIDARAGRGGIASAGDVRDNAIGDESTR